MKRGSEIIKEWERDALEDHKRNFIACGIMLLIGGAIILVTPFIISGDKRSVFTLILSMIFGYFLFLGLIKLIEAHGKMVRRERREWEQFEKRLRHKTKIQ